MIVSLAEADVIGGRRRAAAEEARAAALEREAGGVHARVEAAQARLARIEQLSAMLDRVASRVKDAPEAVTPSALARAFATMRGAFPEEYAVFGVAHAAPALAAPVIAAALRGWRPMEDPGMAGALLMQWRAALGGGGGGGEGEGGVQLELAGAAQLRGAGDAAYAQLVEAVVMGPVRQALANSWKVHDNAQTAAALVSALAPVLPSGALSLLAEQSILPKLRLGLAQWSYRDQGLGLHAWVLPWAKLLGHRLAELFPEIRRKLAAGLKRWRPDDDVENEAALSALQPWAGVMDARSLEALLGTSIAPALAHELRDNFTVNPAQQDLAPLQRVLKWAALLPLQHTCALLEGEVFPKWRTALHHWLVSGSADLGEVARWYQGWKSLFPDAIAADARVQSQFTAALAAMDCVLRGAPPPPPPRAADASYARALDERRAAAAAARRAAAAEETQMEAAASAAAAAARRSAAAGGGDVTFREVVEALAMERGIAFVPKPGRFHLGRQVYAFGGVSVYMDQSVAYVETGGAWSPISLDDLVEYARNKQR
ncbi:GC-rich sequence DNA-binding factor-like protein-domain-containing protein [Tribonema minus]|uniref:GC-rich sequence DNA-binding factor-like protein-domain-containing protein n=1 Tax=Tribonema minus TaxID=303371 RepID=A0A835YJ69_9STRA|nr:GC-rich sequence DNA-binding factor-like protein-domain-containing protein [Tribonema minus]